MSEFLGQPSTENVNRERFRIDAEDFPILGEQLDDKGEPLSIDWIASLYVSETAKLIADIDGTSEEGAERSDYVIYLDKSARPVSWFVNCFWRDFAAEDPERPGQQIERPPHSYLNIDRVSWFRRIGAEVDANGNGRRKDGSYGRLGFNDFDVDLVTREDLAGIRALFIEGGIDSEDPDQIFNKPTILDGKKLLIIDEVRNSGSTIGIASFLLKAAIPELESVRGNYFWERTLGTKLTDEDLQMGGVPVWYNSQTPYGRGAGDVFEPYYYALYEKYKNDLTRARRMGAFVLSTPIGEDPKTRELAREVQELEKLYREGKILLLPPFNYGMERSDEILERQGFHLNEHGEFSDFVKIREEIRQEKAR